MKLFNYILVTVLILPFLSEKSNSQGSGKGKDKPGKYTVASYYFPNYHVDPRNEKRHGSGWTEWELVKAAKPRFSGHHQPNVPLWGYTDEADPAAMSQKIDAATNHGIDAFIFDWYYYNDGLFLERALEQGFMKAPNNHKMKFSLMWANHDWIDIHPMQLDKPADLLYPGVITPANFEKMTDYIISKYFTHPSYWKINGAPYFSIYEVYRLVMGFGSIEATAKALSRFREKTKAAGFKDLHLNAITWGVKILPGETSVKNPAELVNALGFNSVTSYVWIHNVPLKSFPVASYKEVMKVAAAQWPVSAAQFNVPYYPNVTMGWDSSPRASQNDPFVNKGYPFMSTLGGNTPELFRQSLGLAKQFLDTQPAAQRILTINCWNEWTEGSYLEPDKLNGMKYLEAVRSVFKN